MSAILNFRCPIMGSLKSPCRTSYWSSIGTTALDCLVFEKIAFHVRLLATNKRTNRWTAASRKAALAGLIRSPVNYMISELRKLVPVQCQVCLGCTVAWFLRARVLVYSRPSESVPSVGGQPVLAVRLNIFASTLLSTSHNPLYTVSSYYTLCFKKSSPLGLS